MKKRLPRVGISACLLGEAVRYDGRHKYAAQIVETLSDVVSWVPLCPETEAGLGVPRPPVELIGSPGSFRVVGVEDSGLDVTTRLLDFSRKKVRNLGRISGFILQSRSPSCGLKSVPFRGSGLLGAGVFAGALKHELPELPVAEDVDLDSAAVLDEFLRRVRRYDLNPR
ncbi:MAG: DUF523 domain-containing protein [gamma proteobacterium endosymbiont of Lamellibrachia anaximandri]|nr:DUF523 domain-containing protein [gamma proteobacterium endosymbiont of Lamellibrachia anaximandri]